MVIWRKNEIMIRLSKSAIGKEEIEAVKDVLEREYLGMGKDVERFEKELEEFIGRPVVCVNTGTAALHLACQAIDLKSGDEVLVQSLTFLATFQAISASGAIPVPCEVDPATLTLDLCDAEKKLTKKTKAIMLVHYSGGCGNIESYYNFAQRNNLRVIEDAAHAFGSTYKNKRIGSFGDVVCFSFDGIKNITSGEGGAITSADGKLLERIKDLRLLGVVNDTYKRFSGERSWEFDVVEQGWRYHMSNIMAAIGRIQLKRFPEFKNKRQELAKKYRALFGEIPGVKTLELDYSAVVPHIFVVLVPKDIRNEISSHLNNIGIQTGRHYKPNHLLSYYKGGEYLLQKTEEIFDKLITLPLHPELTDQQVHYIVNEVEKYIQSIP
ncbi:MAG: DegT/DnrJ/EryC1/StrS family aminotransferase [Candidatus Hodarchaeota archaeon]